MTSRRENRKLLERGCDEVRVELEGKLDLPEDTKGRVSSDEVKAEGKMTGTCEVFRFIALEIDFGSGPSCFAPVGTRLDLALERRREM